MYAQLGGAFLLALAISGCSAFGGGREDEACRDALSGGGVPLTVCQSAGKLRVYAPENAAIDPAALASVAQSTVNVASLPVATSARQVVQHSQVSDCWVAPQADGTSQITCALSLRVGAAPPTD